MRTIVDLLDDAAAGPGTLQVLPDDPVSLASLWAGSQGAGQAISNAAGTGGNVGALLTSSLAGVTGALGVWLSGNTLVSLPMRAPRQDAADWRKHIVSMCDLSGVEMILVPDEVLPDLSGLAVAAIGYRELSERPGLGACAGGRGDLIQFTSGSTSSPKGVVLSGTALAANILAICHAVNLGNDDLTVSWLPLTHDMGLVGMLLCPLTAAAPRYGGRGAVLMPPSHFLRDPSAWLGACSDLGGTVTAVPNFAFDLAVRASARRQLNLSALRVCVSGAERVQADAIRAFARTFAPAGLSELAICPAYGMAENGLAVTMALPGTRWRSAFQGGLRPDAAVEVVSAGTPLDNVDLRVDAQGTAAGSGQVGEIVFTSPSLLSGYLGGEVPTTYDGWFRTADLGFLRDGELFVVGRSDDILSIEGQNIYPGDLENAASSRHSYPNSIAAIPADDRGVALLVEVRKTETGLDSVARTLTASVARRTGVVVSHIYFVRRGSLSRTSSGKLQRRKIARELSAGMLDIIADFGR
jgi:acyl-CoA synthetase (AMP-forming)/AMP-acid ligase II